MIDQSRGKGKIDLSSGQFNNIAEVGKADPGNYLTNFVVDQGT